MARRLLLRAVQAFLVSLSIAGCTLIPIRLVSSRPQPGALLIEPPARVILVFSDALDGEQSSFSIRNLQDGSVVGLGQIDLADLDRKTISGSVNPQARDGVYIVQWQVVAGYTKAEARGTFSFTIDSTAAARNSDQSQEDTVVGDLAAMVALAAVIALVSGVVLSLVRRGQRRVR
jgi:methionine-rich copper-binding protein CopC